MVSGPLMNKLGKHPGTQIRGAVVILVTTPTQRGDKLSGDLAPSLGAAGRFISTSPLDGLEHLQDQWCVDILDRRLADFCSGEGEQPRCLC
jgi:hypothetical protein